METDEGAAAVFAYIEDTFANAEHVSRDGSAIIELTVAPAIS